MIIHTDSQAFKTLAESLRTGLTVILRDANGADQQATALKLVAQSQHIVVIGDAQVGTNLVLLNIARADSNNNLSVIAQLHQHFQLAVRLEAGQYAAGVEIVEQLAAKFKIKLVAKLGDTLLDVFGLDFEILLVVETVFHKTKY